MSSDENPVFTRRGLMIAAAAIGLATAGLVAPGDAAYADTPTDCYACVC